jgi:2-oxoisovalerate dehydrogenase E1 component subunit beta
VIFFEPKRLYWKRRRQPRELSEPATPLSARIVRRGSDITVVGFGAILEEVLAAAGQVASTTDVEVVDLRWIAPLDVDTILESVGRTGRLLVVHEAIGFVGVGAEVIATVAEHGSHHLTTPMRRLAAPRRIYPPADYEKHYLIGIPEIVGAIEEMCA